MCFLVLRGVTLPDLTAYVRFLLFNDVVKLLFECFNLLGVFDHLCDTPNLIPALNNNDNVSTWFLEINNPKTVNRQVETHSV